MSEPPPKKLIKVLLTNQGEDVETPWAEDLGPASGSPGARRVRLHNVPFLYAKPTWGDVIVVEPDDDGRLTWDQRGVEWENLLDRIEEDGGRWAMIVEYAPHPGVSAQAALNSLCAAEKTIDILVEGSYGPANGKAGRAYIAVAENLSAETVMRTLAVSARCEVRLVHPAPDADG